MKNWALFQASRSILRQLSNDLEEGLEKAESRRAAKEATFWMRFPGSGCGGKGNSRMF